MKPTQMGCSSNKKRVNVRFYVLLNIEADRVLSHLVQALSCSFSSELCLEWLRQCPLSSSVNSIVFRS